MFAVMFGGACAGLAGAYLPLAYTPFFIPGMTAGRGWIALALVVFASWRPGAAGDRRLPVRRGDDPAISCAGRGHRRAVAIDVVVAVSCDRDRAGVAFARPDRRLDRACRVGNGVRARPLISISRACATGRGASRTVSPRLSGETMRKTFLAAPTAFLLAGSISSGISTSASAADKLKVGFIYLGPVGDLGWTYQHELARQALVKEFGDKIETTYLENVPEGPDAERSIEQLVRAGNKLIFTTSFGYMDPTAKVAKKYPGRAFRTRSGYKRDTNMATYRRAGITGPLHPGRDRRPRCRNRACSVTSARSRSRKSSWASTPRCSARRSINPNIKVKIIWANSWFDPGKEADPPRRCSIRAPMSSCSTPTVRRRCRSRASAASSRSARIPR